MHRRTVRAASIRRSRFRRPDDIGRKQLVQLYGKGLPLGDTLVNEADGAPRELARPSSSELCDASRRPSISWDGGTTIASADLGEALDHMLFASGKLNIKLLAERRKWLRDERIGQVYMTATESAGEIAVVEEVDGAPKRYRTPASDLMPDRYPPIFGKQGVADQQVRLVVCKTGAFTISTCGAEVVGGRRNGSNWASGCARSGGGGATRRRIM